MELELSISINFGGLEAVLAEVHSIASDKRTAFQARLKNFLRLGLLGEVQAGRGRAAAYRPEHVILFATALQLSEFGVTPERAVRLVRDSLPHIAEGVMLAIDPDTLQVDRSIYIQVPTSSMEELSDLKPSEWGLGCSPAEDLAEVVGKISSVPAAAFRMAVFSLSGLLSWIPAIVFGEGDDRQRDFRASLREWAEPQSLDMLIDHWVPRSREHGLQALRTMKQDGRYELAARFAVAHGFEAEWREMAGGEDG